MCFCGYDTKQPVCVCVREEQKHLSIVWMPMMKG